MKSFKNELCNYKDLYWIYLGKSCHLDDLERLLFSYRDLSVKNNVLLHKKCCKKVNKIKNVDYLFHKNIFSIFRKLIKFRNKSTLIISTNINFYCLILLIIEKLFSLNIIHIVHNQTSFKSSYGILQSNLEKFLTSIFWNLPNKRAVCSTHVYNSQLKINPKIRSKETFYAGFPLINKSSKIPESKRIGKTTNTLIWGRQTPYKSIKDIDLYVDFCESNKINMDIILLTKFNKNERLESRRGSYVRLLSIDCYADKSTIDYFREVADFEFFPYLNISQSGPIRLAMENGKKIIIPKIALSQCEEANYKNYIIYEINSKNQIHIENFKSYLS